MSKTMTQREFYEAVINECTGEVADYAAEAIVKLDAANAKRKEAQAKKKAEQAEVNAPIAAAIREFLGSADEGQLAKEIAAAVSEALGETFSTQKIGAVIRQMDDVVKGDKKGSSFTYLLG